MPAVVVNGRFLTRPTTGVERYGREILGRSSGAAVVTPRGSGEGLRGHLWEQLVLPGRLPGRTVLWSPANTGPILVRHQVVTIHDLSVLDHPEWFSRSFATWYRLLLPVLTRRVRRIITDSTFSRQRLIERFRIPAEVVCTVRPGVAEVFSPATPEAIAELRRTYDLPEAYILSVGSLEPRKNLRTLLEAWSLIRTPDSRTMLVIAGTSRRTFQGAGLDRQPARTRLIGRVSDAELPALYSGAQAFVFPSVYEGFGLPVLEAMACGTPVIASCSTALPEVVGDAGMLVEPTDAEAIASALERVLGDETLRSELRELGRAHAATFSWERTAQRVWEILGDVGRSAH